MVTHTWSNIFVHTIAAIVAHVQGSKYYFSIVPALKTFRRVRHLMEHMDQESLRTVVWMCPLCINQHTVGCHTSPWPCNCPKEKISTGPMCEVAAFDVMINVLSQSVTGFSQIVALDRASKLTVTFATAGRDITSLGFKVDGSSGLVLHVEKDAPDNALIHWASRKMQAGDRLVSVNECTEMQSMEETLAKPSDITELIAERPISAVTRIWIVAEIAEVRRKNISQHIVSHFPLSLVGPQGILSIQTADIREIRGCVLMLTPTPLRRESDVLPFL